jgi:hypothetical protein
MRWSTRIMRKRMIQAMTAEQATVTVFDLLVWQGSRRTRPQALDCKACGRVPIFPV